MLWNRVERSFSGFQKLKKYLRLLKNTKCELIIALITGVIYGLTSGLGVPLMLKFVSGILFTKEHIQIYIVLLFAFCPLLVILVRAGCEIINAYYIGYCGQSILKEIRVMVFDKIQHLPLDFFKKTEPGEFITRALGDTAVLQSMVIEVSQEIIKQPMAVIGALLALIYLCYQQSNVAVLLIFMSAIPLVVIPVRMIGEKMRKKSLNLQKDSEKIMTQLAHNLSAVQEVRAFMMEETEVQRFREICNKVMFSVMKTVKYSVILSPIIEIIAAGGVGVAMVYTYAHGIGPDVFVAMTGALYFSYDPIKKIARLNNQIKAGMASLERIEELFDQPEVIVDPVKPANVNRLHNIVFKNVSFSYDNECEVLHDINFELNRGNTYAFVGNSGAGKTTVINLILRFYDVSKGSINIDGIDIRDMRVKDLRKNISIVPQFPTLINGTILDNILWSAPWENRDAVVRAAKRAYAHEFISEFEEGYDTFVGESGMRLSGGQKQRIALARAFLRNAPILILDEATSSLDANSEHAVHKAIEDLIVDKTAILISHRFTMMSIVDKVFVLNKGSIVEEGSPGELLREENSLYYSYQKQQGI